MIHFVLALFPPVMVQVTPFNPGVIQNNILQTICVPGYTKTIHTSISQTNKTKQDLYEQAAHGSIGKVLCGAGPCNTNGFRQLLPGTSFPVVHNLLHHLSSTGQAVKFDLNVSPHVVDELKVVLRCITGITERGEVELQGIVLIFGCLTHNNTK